MKENAGVLQRKALMVERVLINWCPSSCDINHLSSVKRLDIGYM
jgi:hypothetical protein